MKKQTAIIWLISFSICEMIGCKTYYIPVDSFKAQFKGIDSTKLRVVHMQGPLGGIESYLANPFDYIKCVDKDNTPFELKNGPSIEIRFTEKNNKRTVYYFDRLYLRDTVVIGEISRIMGIRKCISINNVKLIEIQDGRKNYRYVQVQK